MSLVFSAYAVACQRGQIDVEGDDLRVLFVDDTYTVDDAHQALDDVPSGARVGTTTTITGIAVQADGRVLADDVTVPAVTGDPIAGMVVYQHTGTESTSVLCAFYDRQSDSTLIDWTPTGGAIEVRWPAGRVLKL